MRHSVRSSSHVFIVNKSGRVKSHQMSRGILPLTAFLSRHLGTWVLWVLCGKSFQNTSLYHSPLLKRVRMSKCGQEAKAQVEGLPLKRVEGMILVMDTPKGPD
jgi:hypothetical protein